MRRLFEILGIVFLICFSFIYTEKSINVVREQDPLMQKIVDNQYKYNVPAVDVKIINKVEIIPGYNGSSVDIYKSYTNMKKIGKYDIDLFKFKEEVPKKSINNIYDKYITNGNNQKKSIALVFNIASDSKSDNVVKIIDILKKQRVNATFFLDSKWLEDNTNILIDMVRNSNEIASLGYDGKYNKDSLVWYNNFIETITNIKIKYCYVDHIDNDVLDLCKAYKMHTIKPKINITNFPFNNIKNNIDNGSIINININNEVVKELDTIISFIRYKGYKINILREHLSEKH
jgi:peptidoglycan-N-acetylglucosamine deacetylase